MFKAEERVTRGKIKEGLGARESEQEELSSLRKASHCVTHPEGEVRDR